MIYTKMYDVSFLPDILLRVGIGVVIVAIYTGMLLTQNGALCRPMIVVDLR